jgi:hypothetical protein
MTDNHIQLMILFVQALTLISLIVYCVQTFKLRKTAQEQVEGMSKPCLIFLGELRDGADAILETHGATGNVVARGDQGSYVVQNIGSGVALKVHYCFSRNTDRIDQPRSFLHVPYILPSAKISLVETLGGYCEQHEVTLYYESISGREYLSTIQLNNHVITSFAFAEVR